MTASRRNRGMPCQCRVLQPRGWTALLGLALSLASGWTADRILVQEYATELAAETPAAREERHRVVAGRRDRVIVMVHRGASAMAPENSIEACAAALDYGADGCEIDLRRTRDGVLVLFHDASLDRMTQGFGRVDQATFRELQSLPARQEYGPPLATIIPTFTALLEVARQRAMLLHLDLKEAGMESEVIRLLDAAEAWDHVVHVNAEHAAGLTSHPRFRPLRYKVPGLYAGRRDLDPEAVASSLAQPGHMILVDDPRVAVQVLGRPPYQPQPFTKSLRIASVQPLADALAPDGELLPLRIVRHLSRRHDAADPAALLRLMVEETGPRDPVQRSIERAWAAQRLGDIRPPTRSSIAALRQQASQPTPHPEEAYDRLDAASAIRALGRLKATESASGLIRLLRFDWPPRGPTAEPLTVLPVGSPSRPTEAGDPGQYRVTRCVLLTLGELRCRAARRSLEDYVQLDESSARRYGPPQYELATRALLRQRLAWDDIGELLRSRNPAVRGTALIECLDRGTEERNLALRQAAPWALSLPRARR